VSLRDDICRRIAHLRLETAGARGKSLFAKQLGISPSTYDYYEHARVPPASILVRIAEVTGADLRWLLTGESSVGDTVPADHPVLQRAAKLLARCPDAAGPLRAFLDILSEAMKFPKGDEAGTAQQARPAIRGSYRERPEHADPEAPAAAEAGERVSEPSAERQAAARQTGWIPVLGRSAAGVPHFWADRDEAAGLTTLDDLIARHASAEARSVRPASVAGAEGGEKSAVQIVLLPAPEAGELTEFVVAPAIKARCPDAFALRIDGDSMAPDIRHGDLVVLSPSCPAADGKPAVVQLDGQIGVTCKLLRRGDDVVHLVPVNERYEIGTFPADQVVWALRVLARVRS